MPADLLSLVGIGHETAFEKREALARELVASAPFGLEKKTCSLTLLAGAGTRWAKSLSLAKARLDDTNDGPAARFPLDAPRGLFPVRNFISAEPSRIPMAAYALDAVKGLGRHVIVIRGWEAEIRSGIVEALGIDGESVKFCTQKVGPSGKVLGHGDAARQSRELWRDSTYVIANFGGDANSPLTVAASLLAMARLDELGENVGLLLPVAKIKNPAYLVILDERGLPRAFGHNKLGGMTAGGLPPSEGYTNVGIRVYRTEALSAAVDEIESSY
ncbi:MAG: hypothetical protein WCX13_00740, partial [Candidatus Hydrogenedentales bacterium]